MSQNNRTRLLKELIANHGAALERFLARKLNNAQDAAEIAQETYLRLYRLDELEQVDDTRAFLFRVAGNMAIDQLRRRVLHEDFLAQDALARDGEGDEPGSDSPERITAAREELRRIYQAIDGLPLKCRQAFLLHRKAGLNYQDIATEMNISVSSVEKYILQALQQCRRAMVSDRNR